MTSNHRYRSAVEGQFIDKKEADRNPGEAVKEKIATPTQPKDKPRSK